MLIAANLPSGIAGRKNTINSTQYRLIARPAIDCLRTDAMTNHFFLVVDRYAKTHLTVEYRW